ncbi:hypothetical protein [Streptomyces sp. NPDC051286]|uniref:hypothetical protein n=1 Tax=Streptomyces sp. NPDC051286 TaxID=3365647 RepID=UPI00378D0698
MTQEFNSCGYHPTTTIHLRNGPGARHASLGLLGSDDTIPAYGERGGWYRPGSLDLDRADLSCSGVRSGGWQCGWDQHPATWLSSGRAGGLDAEQLGGPVDRRGRRGQFGPVRRDRCLVALGRMVDEVEGEVCGARFEGESGG